MNLSGNKRLFVEIGLYALFFFVLYSDYAIATPAFFLTIPYIVFLEIIEKFFNRTFATINSSYNFNSRTKYFVALPIGFFLSCATITTLSNSDIGVLICCALLVLNVIAIIGLSHASNYYKKTGHITLSRIIYFILIVYGIIGTIIAYFYAIGTSMVRMI